MAWTEDELARVGASDELRIASARTDGTLRPAVIIWVVTVDTAVFVRSAYGSTNPWFRRAIASGRGRITVPGLERDVRFEPPEGADHDAIDAAYHAKYDRYGPAIVGSVVGPGVRDVTLRLLPAEI